MHTHFEVGHKYPTVRINTTYSFGLDDQEFVLAFETTNLSDFLDLVMELRENSGQLVHSEGYAHLYGYRKPLRECLDALG